MIYVKVCQFQWEMLCTVVFSSKWILAMCFLYCCQEVYFIFSTVAGDYWFWKVFCILKHVYWSEYQSRLVIMVDSFAVSRVTCLLIHAYALQYCATFKAFCSSIDRTAMVEGLVGNGRENVFVRPQYRALRLGRAKSC